MGDRRRLAVGVLMGMIACATLAAGGQAPTAPRRGGNPEAAKRVNPVAASPESLSAGRRAYNQFCANCHGAAGKGDGSGGAAGSQPADLTDAMWDYGSTDGEIYGVIHDGTSNEMGSYAERLKDADIWNIVNYVRSLAAKK
jgi:mono/diheme cytochrome c family protein